MTARKLGLLVLTFCLIQCAFTEVIVENEHARELAAAAPAAPAKGSEKEGGSDAASNAIDAAKACYAGFVANIPPSFCYKKGADFGTIPTTCSSGYFRYLALCYRNCDPGYYFSIGVCWETCRGGYANHPASCYKHLFDWYFKKSYIPSSYTNFDSRVGCEVGKYKFGALCYRDCGKKGLVNCGIGACAASMASCLTSIISMGIDFLMGLAKAVTLIFTLGQGAAAEVAVAGGVKAVLVNGLEKIGISAIKGAASQFKNFIVKLGTSAFYKQMAEYAVKNLAKFTAKSIAIGTITTVCENVGKAMMGKMDSSSGIEIKLQNFDLTGISNAVITCKDIKTEDDKVYCAKSVLQAIDFVDPTGVVGMVASVIQPICDSAI